MRRQLVLDAVEATQVVSTFGIRVLDRGLAAACTRLGRCSHEHAQDALAARERERRRVGDDDDTAPAGGFLDRLPDERPHVVGQVSSRDRSEPVCLGAATRAQLREHAAEQRLTPLRVRDVLDRDVSSLGRSADDVLVDVVEAELAGDEPTHVLASGTHRSRDADDGRGHCCDVRRPCCDGRQAQAARWRIVGRSMSSAVSRIEAACS